MFEPSGLGLTILQDRYSRNGEETWEEKTVTKPGETVTLVAAQ